MFTIDDTLAPEAYPLAFLLGRWSGQGLLGYEGVIEPTAFSQVMEFSHDGGPYLACTSTLRVPENSDEEPDSDGQYQRIWSVESSYWRVTPDPEKPVHSAQSHDSGMPGAIIAPLEVMVAEPTGHLTLYIGEVEGVRITLASDAIVRTSSASEMTAAKRLYGLVEGQLMWAYDIAAFGHPLASYASARLERVGEEA